MIKKDLEKYKVLTSYNLHQLELDYLQNLALIVLYDKFSSLYFKGGTCLQKCYGIKRFSEDLDFNYENIDLDELLNYLKNYFPFEFEIKDRKKTNFGETIIILIKGLLYDGARQSLCKLSLDFRKGDTYKKSVLKEINPIYEDIPKYSVLTLDLEEILSEKIRAILTRTKARDVFDLYELLKMGLKIDLDLVNLKLKSYGVAWSKKDFFIKCQEKEKIYVQELSNLMKVYPSFKEVFDYIKKFF
jgi:predicted nucleotidyltransferase component of viral defense system